MSIGFKHSLSDPNLYVMEDKDGMIMLTLYVDDLVVAATTQVLMDIIKQALMDKFKMKNLRNLACCLGVQVLQNRKLGTITIH